MSYDWFPLGLAQGAAFCNRELERQQLANNFNMTRHSLLVSPRRYGKTSLVMQAIQENHCIAAKIDFFSVLTKEAAQQKILDGIGHLIPQLLTKAELALKIAKDFLKHFHLSIQYKAVGFSLGITPVKTDTSQAIVSALRAVEQIAEKTGHKVVLFIDEFQALSNLEKESLIIEGALREAAQEAKHTAYVFSGSNRHLLTQLFDDSSRPLYLLCHRITIDRIAKEAYVLHLKKAAKNIWKKTLSDTVIHKILELTKHHPYYVNALCSRLWSNNAPPTEDLVNTTWERYAMEERSRIAAELDLLSQNQRKLLVMIARSPGITSPSSQTFLKELNLSSASALQSLTVLMKKDYIEQQKNSAYRLLDPVMEILLGANELG